MSVNTEQFLCLMFIGLFKVKTWVLNSSNYSSVLWLSLHIRLQISKLIIKYNRWQRRFFTLSVQLYSYVISVNSCICPTKLLIKVIIKCLPYSEISGILCALCSVFTLFHLILENMATNGRKCCLPCYIWHLWRRL